MSIKNASDPKAVKWSLRNFKMRDLFNIWVTCVTLCNLSDTLLNDSPKDQTGHLPSCCFSHPVLIMMFVFAERLCSWHSNGFSTCGLSWCDDT